MLWTDKYAPRSLQEVRGNEEARAEILKWAHEFKRGKIQKPLLLHGPPGVGKTASARALAGDFGWPLVESNASDIRSSKQLKRVFGDNSRSLFGERLIFLDEIDGAFDRGEFPELVEIIKQSTRPMLLTANNLWDKHLAPVRLFCKPVEFKKVNSRSVADLLAGIAASEGVEANKETIQAIAKNCKGDVRSAIIDLQSGGEASRERETNVFEAVRTVFKTMNFNESINASDGVDMDLDTFTKWLEENVPAEYEDAGEKAEAFKWLAKSSAMQGRIRKKQYWGLLRYVRTLSHAGVSLSKKESYRKFTPYRFPSLLKTLSQGKKERALRKSACLKIGKALHCSGKKANENLAVIAGLQINRYAGLSEDEEKLLKSLGNQLEPEKHKKRKEK